MRIKLCLLLWLGLLATVLQAGTIQYQAINLGGNQFQYSYLISGFTLQANQEIDIRFDPTLFGTLSNGVAGSDFSLLLLQPNNPPGASGDYAAFTAIANPSLAGPFRVDVTFLGSGQPGGQPFFINQYGSAHNFLFTDLNQSGTTVSVIPEPGSFTLCGAGIILVCLWTVRRRAAVTGRRDSRTEY